MQPWVKVKVAQSCLTLWLYGLYSSWNSPDQNTGEGRLSFLQGIFPTQGSNPGLPHCRQIPYQLSHKGSPRILEWVTYPFSSLFSWPRNQTRVSCIAGRFFTNWAYEGSPVTLRYVLKFWFFMHMDYKTITSCHTKKIFRAIIQKETCNPVFIAVLLTIDRT